MKKRKKYRFHSRTIFRNGWTITFVKRLRAGETCDPLNEVPDFIDLNDVRKLGYAGVRVSHSSIPKGI